MVVLRYCSSHHVSAYWSLPDVFHCVALSGEDELSKPFQYYLTVFFDDHLEQLADLIGVDINIEIEVGGDVVTLHGIINAVVSCDDSWSIQHGYTLEIVSTLHQMGIEKQSRIFHDLSVIDIIKTVLHDMKVFNVDFSRLVRTYATLPYCTQYQETALQFISRLLDAAGIVYYFEHDHTEHQCVLIDKPSSLPVYQAGDVLDIMGAYSLFDNVEQCYHVTPQSVTINSAQWQRDSTVIQSHYNITSSYHISGLSQAWRQTCFVSTEQFYCFMPSIKRYGLAYEKAQYSLVLHSNKLWLAAGFRCDVMIQEDQLEYLLLDRVVYSLVNEPYHSVLSSTSSHYLVTLYASPVQVDFPFNNRCRQPFVSGMQLATVIDTQQADGVTNQSVRVKVAFDWGNASSKSSHHSGWIRVAQYRAGGGCDVLWRPRVGQTVGIEFLYGDPDQPVVVKTWVDVTQSNHTDVSTAAVFGYSAVNNAYYSDVMKGNAVTWSDDGQMPLCSSVAQNDQYKIVSQSMTVEVAGHHVMYVQQGNYLVQVEQGSYELSAVQSIVCSNAASALQLTPESIVINSSKIVMN